MSSNTAATTAGPAGLVVHLGPDDLEAQLCRDARAGLTAPAKSIPSKWFYDHDGSMLFDEITRLPEYYLTRAERQILVERADDVVRRTGASTMLELGCGVSEKTRILLDAFDRAGGLETFVPFDVDGAVLRGAAMQLNERYPDLTVRGIVGDFERHLGSIDVEGPCLVIFLGSTIGNLTRAQRSRFLQDLAGTLKPGDWFLLGADLVKDVPVIEAAYNDSQGVSAAFNRNMLRVLNTRLGADFDVEEFEHVARFNPVTEQMEMFLRARTPQRVRLEALDLEVEFAEGELLHTEISAKFRRVGLESELRRSGLRPRAWWTDPAGHFALSLAARS